MGGVWVIKYDRQLVSTFFIFYPLKSSYDSFDWMEWIQEGAVFFQST